MKKAFFICAALALPCSLWAQWNNPSAPYEDIEAFLDAGGSGQIIWDVIRNDVANTNASACFYPGTNSDLYVTTWDGGAPVIDNSNGGFLVRQYPAGTAINNSTAPTLSAFKSEFINFNNFPGLHLSSMEAGFVIYNGVPYVAVTAYSQPLPSGAGTFVIYTYRWDPVGGALSIFPAQAPLMSVPVSATDGWIHQDINEEGQMVITWDANGRIYSAAANFDPIIGGMQPNGIASLSLPYADPGKPDVAMMEQPNGQTDLYYVLTANNNQELAVYKGDLNVLNGLTGVFPVTPLYQKTTTGAFGLPRIDAPNRCNTQGDEIWSIVVADHQSGGHQIFAADNSNDFGFHEQVLNDGSFGTGIPAISLALNRRPTVSYSPYGNELFYA